MRLKLLRKDVKASLEDLFRKEITVPERKPKSKQNDRAPPVEEVATEFGPAAILSFDPPIFYSGIAFEENIGIAPAFAKIYGDLPAAFSSTRVGQSTRTIGRVALSKRQRRTNKSILRTSSYSFAIRLAKGTGCKQRGLTPIY